MTCQDCGAAIDTASRYCSDRCRLHAMRQRRARQRVIDAGGPWPCQICGAEVWKYGAINCGVECRAEANRRKTKARQAARVAAGWVRPSQRKPKPEPKPNPVKKQQPYRPRAASLAKASR